MSFPGSSDPVYIIKEAAQMTKTQGILSIAISLTLLGSALGFANERVGQQTRQNWKETHATNAEARHSTHQQAEQNRREAHGEAQSIRHQAHEANHDSNLTPEQRQANRKAAHQQIEGLRQDTHNQNTALRHSTYEANQQQRELTRNDNAGLRQQARSERHAKRMQ